MCARVLLLRLQLPAAAAAAVVAVVAVVAGVSAAVTCLLSQELYCCHQVHPTPVPTAVVHSRFVCAVVQKRGLWWSGNRT